MDTILLLVGLLLILGGANYLTDGAVAIAKRFEISEFVVGLTIVAIGTSMPEMVVSVISAIQGNGDIAVGNVVGSNVFNTFAILGLCAFVRPVYLSADNIRKDIPLGVIVSAILVLVAMPGYINRPHGMAMLIAYLALMFYSIRKGKTTTVDKDNQSPHQNSAPQMRMWLAVLLVIGGLAALIGGGQLFLDSAVRIAEYFGIPQSVIAITLVAGGTSLPELAASVVSLIKGKSDIALGNVIGSNIANILLVLGASSAITPLSLGGVTIVDVLVVLGGSLMLWVVPTVFKKNRLSRLESVIMLLVFVGYIYYIVA
ncbi:MAG: calcium/sodium antiporter [Rikenellaceae bacterium]